MCWSFKVVVNTWSQFPNIGFLAKQIFKILVLHIETKCVFNLVGVSTTLKRCSCSLHVKNLNHISTMMKNWYNDPYLNCLQHKDLINVIKVEHLLVEENYYLIEESNYFEQLELNKWFDYIWQGEIINIFIGFSFVLGLIEFQIWMTICIWKKLILVFMWVLLAELVISSTKWKNWRCIYVSL
jgi:hypothetical protein